MYVTLNVTKWQSSRSSNKRVGTLDGENRSFIINPSKIIELQANGTGSKFYFDDCIFNRHDKPSYIEAREAPQIIIDAHNTAYSLTTTLPVYKNNNPNLGTENMTILTDSLVYADRYNGSPLDTSWVIIEEGGFSVKAKRALVALSVEDILSGTSLLQDYDGNGYTTVVIGNLEWTIENFRVIHYSDGTEIPEITDGILWQADTDGARCYYDNDSTNFDFIGLLYNWYATNNAHGLAYLERSGVQEVGWRVPTETDFLTLLADVGNDTNTAGGLLKEIGTIHWTPPNVATDVYGFKWISGGNRYIDLPLDPGFSNQGVYGDLWSSTESGVISANSYYTYNENAWFYTLDALKMQGMNIRLVRDV